ncbi:hypothetical protein ACIQZO_18010 [Streptomyces sp. NPDC097617]|uniref:hypothetical protein n=1 Tax=Streptomyces sp. NPDC097617 TaxID=3366091 RepID=UPI00380D5C70
MTSMHQRHDDGEQYQRDDLADARTELAATRDRARRALEEVRRIKRERRAEAIARLTKIAAPVTRGGLMVAGTASIIGAGTQLVAGDADGAADWLSAGVGCWALAILRR